MAFRWNIFRIVADASHFLSKCILIWSIHSNKSAEGVSLITQVWYLIVFLSRYLPSPLYREYGGEHGFESFWNFSFKIFYMLSSAYTIFIMMRMYARTREREAAWKLGGASMAGSLVLAPFVMMIFRKRDLWRFTEFSWTFSIILESTCVLPQLLLLRQTTVPTVIDSFYLVTLGSYRGFYIVNWIVKGIKKDPNLRNEPISIIFGCIQTLLYIDFAWVYFTRQRVKLRGGSIVDSDDLSKGWIVKRLIGRRPNEEEDEEAPAYNHQDGAVDPRPKSSSQRWGPRGISVSADDTTHEAEHDRLNDPKEFEDDPSGDDTPSPRDVKSPSGPTAPLGNGSEWREER